MVQSELKPCPFCGNEEIKICQRESDGYWLVQCQSGECLAVIEDFFERQTAVDTWNFRAPHAALQKLTRQFAEAIKEEESCYDLTGESDMVCPWCVEESHSDGCIVLLAEKYLKEGV